MISVDEAFQLIRGNVAPGGVETIALARALGRVLREPVRADMDQPAFDRSAMDGYAVSGTAGAEGYPIVGILRAGDDPTFTLQAGQCARIFTGARVPRRADAVVPQEEVESDGARMRLKRPDRSTAPTFIRRQGEDARQGDILVPAGARLRGSELGILASVGASQPVVAMPPRVVHLVTGSELVEPDEVPGEGQIRDSNSALMAGLVAEAGCLLARRIRVPEDRDASLNVMAEVDVQGRAGFDVLLISGGASVGDHDHTPEMLECAGFAIHFRQVSVRPGKPFIFATRGKQVAFGIPGNPVSHFVTFHLFIRAALEGLLGQRSTATLFRSPLAEALPERTNPRETYWPARLIGFESGLAIQPLPWQSSGHLSSLSEADALIRIPAGTAPQAAGALVEWRRI